MIASSSDRAKHPAAFYLWLGLSAMSACVGGHVAYAADLTIPSGGILALLRPPAMSAPWLLLEGKRTLPSVDCNPLRQGPAGPRQGPG
jgi:hypothetical protein